MTDSAPPPAPAPQPAPAGPRSGTPEKWNVLSIVAFVIVFFGFSLVSIILGFIGLNQIKKTGERGRGLALWAIVLGFVSIIIGIIVSDHLRHGDRGEPEPLGQLAVARTRSPRPRSTERDRGLRRVRAGGSGCVGADPGR